jgi:hypothetical protein
VGVGKFGIGVVEERGTARCRKTCSWEMSFSFEKQDTCVCRSKRPGLTHTARNVVTVNIWYSPCSSLTLDRSSSLSTASKAGSMHWRQAR